MAVEPASSPVLSGGKAGAHKIQGIGAGFVPGNYNESVVDEVIAIPDNEAIKASDCLLRKKVCWLAFHQEPHLRVLYVRPVRKKNEGKTIVAILPDTGERYSSTVLYAFDEYPL